MSINVWRNKFGNKPYRVMTAKHGFKVVKEYGCFTNPDVAALVGYVVYFLDSNDHHEVTCHIYSNPEIYNHPEFLQWKETPIGGLTFAQYIKAIDSY